MTIVYGRPYTKDPKSGETRKIWGGLVPYGKVWRMGADEATLFTTKKAVESAEHRSRPAPIRFTFGPRKTATQS